MLIHKFPLTYPQLKIFFCTQFALTFPITLILYLQRNPADCYIFSLHLMSSLKSPDVSLGQPGYKHGRLGFLGIQPSPDKTKALAGLYLQGLSSMLLLLIEFTEHIPRRSEHHILMLPLWNSYKVDAVPFYCSSSI